MGYRLLWIFLAALAGASMVFAAALLLPHTSTFFSTPDQQGAVPIANSAPGDASKRAGSAASIRPGLKILIYRTLLTLNDANMSGDYSILRKLASPSFQRANSPSKIAGAFADLRRRKIDMAALVNFTPELVRKPKVSNGRLRVTGYVPTRPKQINFDMMFEKRGKRWLLSALSVSVVAPKTAAAAP